MKKLKHKIACFLVFLVAPPRCGMTQTGKKLVTALLGNAAIVQFQLYVLFTQKASTPAPRVCAERARSFFLCPSKVTSHFHNAYEKRALCFALLEHISPFGHCLHFSLSFLLMAFSILFLKNKLSVHAHECTLVSYSFSAAAGWFLFWDFHFC